MIGQVLVERSLPGDKKLQLEIWDEERGPMSTLAERVRKWGDELIPIVAALSAHERIAKVATAVIECETGDEFIARRERRDPGRAS